MALNYRTYNVTKKNNNNKIKSKSKSKSNLNYSAIFYSLKIHVFLLNKADYTFYQKKKKKKALDYA